MWLRHTIAGASSSPSVLFHCCSTAPPHTQVIDLTAGSGARWRNVGPMPTSRVLGDAVLLCDGTVGLFNGAGKGIGVSANGRAGAR